MIATLSVLAIGIGVVATREFGTAAPDDAGSATPLLAANLSQLDLNALQRSRIEEILGAEQPRMARLREAFEASIAALRQAELAQPFDDGLVSSLVAQQAELAGYARGAESRVVSSIVSLLTPAQRHRFAEVRLGRLDHLAALDGR
jgi:Spy/CpxP family protein refolding chaperone